GRDAGVAVAARLPVGLEAAARGAAVPVGSVAVVAFLTGIDVAVAAAPELPRHHRVAAGQLRLPPHHHHVAGAGDADRGARVLDARIGGVTHRERRALQAAIAPEALASDATVLLPDEEEVARGIGGHGGIEDRARRWSVELEGAPLDDLSARIAGPEDPGRRRVVHLLVSRPGDDEPAIAERRHLRSALHVGDDG